MTEVFVIVTFVVAVSLIGLFFGFKDPLVCPHEGCDKKGELLFDHIAEGPLFLRISTYTCPDHGDYKVVEQVREDGQMIVSPYTTDIS